MTTTRLRIKPYIQQFERRLALLEILSLCGAEPVPVDGDADSSCEFEVTGVVDPKPLVRRLAYWELISGKTEHLTTQVLREATTLAVRNGVPLDVLKKQLPFADNPPLPNRRCLRYGTHGVHEYRGKFFPQLVKSLLNIGAVPHKGIVADPMCGSGTTLVESVSGKFSARGADINPLSVLMTRTKCALLSESADELGKAYEKLRTELLAPRYNPRNPLSYFQSLPGADQTYLSKWFSRDVLLDLDRVAVTIHKERNAVVRDFFRLALSNILRSVSWQKVDDLRVRREYRQDADIDAVKEFLEEIGRSVRSVIAFQRQEGPLPKGKFDVTEASATQIKTVWAELAGKVDAVITSPPYATALPYIDTDRLSLSYLQLLTRPLHRRRDELMIGNREITPSGRNRYWNEYLSSRTHLPESVVSLIDQIDDLNSSAKVGFRRQNLAALLGRYFLDMREALKGIRTLLKRSGPAYVVVGNNTTTAGGHHIEIRTAHLLADVADSVGLRVEDSVSMDMLTSRDIFRQNSMASEMIICLRRP